jgi:hypothetical protein
MATIIFETCSWKGIFKAENSIAWVWVIGWIVIYKLKVTSLLTLMQLLEKDMQKMGIKKERDTEEIKETRIL